MMNKKAKMDFFVKVILWIFFFLVVSASLYVMVEKLIGG